MQQDIANFLKDKRILVLGYGREGISAVKFIQKYLPEADFAVADRNSLKIDGVKTFSGDDYAEHCKDFDIVIKSPGIPAKEIPTDQHSKITSCVDLFLRYCKNPIIGVTGTKGKSTTSSLCYHILKNCGKDAILAGNIGLSCFEILDDIQPDTIIVLELSCHQLEFIQKSPHVAILLNLYEEHFDHYNSPDEYFNAKKNIFHFQQTDDTLIYGDIFQHCTEAEINEAAAEQKINLATDWQIPAGQIETQLIGEHYIVDIRAAMAACAQFGLEKDAMLEAVKSFQGLPHRLQFIGEHNGIKFYNDSIATAQEAVINALKALPDARTIIVGGMDRGINYQPLIDFLATSQIKTLILLPNTAERIQKQIGTANYDIKIVANMEEAVKVAYDITEPGFSCLLSPAAASYGFYKNFEERGKDFCRQVEKYAKLKTKGLN